MLSGFELFPRWVPLKKVMYVFMVTSKTGAVSNILKKKIMNRLCFVILLKCYFIVIHIGHYHHHIYLFVYYKLLLPSLLLLLITILKSLY